MSGSADPGSRLAPSTVRLLDEGIRLFDHGHWWHAHEAWENAWRLEKGASKLLLQGLIQLAAAYHKGLRMGNPGGMARLFASSFEKLAQVRAVDPRFAGIDLERACAACVNGRAAAEEWAAGTRASFDLADVIRLDAGSGHGS